MIVCYMDTVLTSLNGLGDKEEQNVHKQIGEDDEKYVCGSVGDCDGFVV